MFQTLKRLLLIAPIILISCKDAYKIQVTTPKSIQVSKPLTFAVQDKNNNPLDSVVVTINNKPVVLNENFEASVDISSFKLGRQSIETTSYFNGETKKINKTVFFLADSQPSVYDFEIINRYPHDTKAYTQGLEYHDGFLYESTGRNGQSSIRKVELTTGKVLQKFDLDEQYFGEGITMMGDSIFMLTWRKGVGFIFDKNTFEELGTFKYKNSLQGWGLTNNGEQLIKTDGTERIWFLDPKTQKELSFIEAYTNTRKVEQLNELEYIDGIIYANIYQQNSILMVDSSNGKVVGVADLNKLKAEMAKTQKLVPQDEVLNGIAYDAENDRLFVTGKNWGNVFEIKLIKRQ
ncbi:glutaminyl-peptide cyclotransferase [Urechidicola sp. KH5]